MNTCLPAEAIVDIQQMAGAAQKLPSEVCQDGIQRLLCQRQTLRTEVSLCTRQHTMKIQYSLFFLLSCHDTI